MTPPSTDKIVPVIHPERESSAKNKTASVISLGCPFRPNGWKALKEAIRQGVCRPGAIERELTGLTPKVQNYYFRRMVELNILERVVYPEVQPHVEYRLTDFGLRFMPILDSIEELQCELEAHRKD